MKSSPSLAYLVQQTTTKLMAKFRSSTVERYVGERVPRDDETSITSATEVEVAVLSVDGKSRPLDLRLDIRNHSPAGFNWGYGGSGPAQLAVAILADFSGSDYFAEKLYQQFKEEVVARVRSSRFDVSGELLRTWLEPRLEEFAHETLGKLFDDSGAPSQFPHLPTVWHGPEFAFEWKENGALVLQDLETGTNVQPIDDIPSFYVDAVFPARAARQ